jgi:hypothetical protein
LAKKKGYIVKLVHFLLGSVTIVEETV